MFHMPVDLVLAIEMIAATFYPDAYRRIRREPQWTSARRISQEHLLPDYFKQATDAVRNKSSVLEAFWNVAWE